MPAVNNNNIGPFSLSVIQQSNHHHHHQSHHYYHHSIHYNDSISPLSVSPTNVSIPINNHGEQTSLNRRTTTTPTDVFVNNLPFAVTEQEIRELFSEYVNVTRVRIVRGSLSTILPTGHSTGHGLCPLYAIVTVPSLNAACELVELFSHHMFHGRNIRVAIACPIVHGITPTPRDTNPFDGELLVSSGGAHVALLPRSNPSLDHMIFASFHLKRVFTRPIEVLLRRLLIEYTVVVDIQVISVEEDTEDSSITSVSCEDANVQPITHHKGCALIVLSSAEDVSTLFMNLTTSLLSDNVTTTATCSDFSSPTPTISFSTTDLDLTCSPVATATVVTLPFVTINQP